MKLTKIPRNIFQTWETKNMSQDLLSLTQSWREKNTNYGYFLYDDNDCDKFIKKNFDMRICNAYRRIIPGAFKADLWRYCILYIYGGVYADIDTICYSSIDDFLNEDIEFMTPIDLNNCPTIGTHNLFNSFIASVPKHPILLECINRIVYNVENNNIPNSNLDFSGPGVLGRATNIYLNLNEETPFIEKHGFHSNGKLCLLFFEYVTEYVKNAQNMILFQNKNGNTEIQKVYENEKTNVNYIDWGKCPNPVKPLPTIVTMIYNIREKEKNETGCVLNHSLDKYLGFAKEYILQLPYPLIVFTDDETVIKFIKNERTKFTHLTHIYFRPFEETYFYKDYSRLEELQSHFHILNGHVDHETPLYVILNNNKFDCIDKTIELNPFQSTHLIWMDFGINHVAQSSEMIHDWINKVPDKIKQLCINPFVENIDFKEYFRYIYHNMAGGLFSGSIENMRRYAELFKNKTYEIYSDNWYQIDEAVMTMVHRENPTLFDLFYGDYQGIVANFDSPFHNIELILKGCQKCIDHSELKQAFTILVYCLPYFLNNLDNGLVFYFIELNLKTNYINNNNLLLEEIIHLINFKKMSTIDWQRDLIYNILENYKVYIHYYDNRDRIV